MARGGITDPKIELPSNVDAEQALLGSLLYDNAGFALLPIGLEPGHFFEPFHRRLFQRLKMVVDRGQKADPIILHSAFERDPAYAELGGIRYLADLVDQAPPTANCPDYAREIITVAARRTLVQVGKELIERGSDGAESVDETLAGLEKIVGELHSTGSTIRLIDADEAMDRVLDSIDNPQNYPAGIYTGLGPLDEELGPLLPDDLIVLAGRPGMGKSAIGAIIAQNVALAGHGVIEFHAEMSVEQVWQRRLTATAHSIYASDAPAYASIRKRKLTFDQRQMLGAARDMLRGIPLRSVKRTGLTLGRLRSLAIQQQALWERKGTPLSLIIIDHVGLIRTDREHHSRVDQQTEISNGLKELAGDLKLPIIALAQLNRALEQRDNKRPTLPDLRDSGSWEQDADIVIGAYREAYYAKQEIPPVDTGGKSTVTWAEWDARARSPWIEAIRLKVRAGETGTTKLWAHMPTNTILGAEPQATYLFGENNDER